ncbi:hypothetical protein GCM10011390_24520 [Aureimonas endophytica]|uniref:Blue-light-activated histidine kinase n=1 Tax=Aureimonas endophytica TaxID=2027858 RepID=A0A917E6M6_9HYPH|nr:PAS domain-containing protein [Aureimonas endophytica]GGE04646.1 hypothetical protein GCM10011390_24520 [Aureimonas endophytica]
MDSESVFRSWLPGDGEMAERIRAFDWSQTSLGPIAEWSPTLRTVVGFMVAARQPVFLGWGPETVSLYNDCIVPILGAKHPASLGRSFREVFAEVWTDYEPIVTRTMAGEAHYLEDQPVRLAGRGEDEPSYFTYSWTPLREASGEVAGFLSIATETTAKVLSLGMLRQSERRQAFLLQLSDAIRALGEADEIRTTSTTMLGRHLGANRVAYAEHRPKDATFAVAPNFVDGTQEIVGEFRYEAYGPDILDQLQSGRLRIQPDIQADATLDGTQKRRLAEAGVAASLNVPVLKQGRLVAFLGVNYASPHVFEPAEIELVEEVAARTWTAIERARAEALLRQRELDLARVQRIGEVGGLDIDIANGLRSKRSPEYLRLHGLSATGSEETHAQWRARVHPDDREAAERTLFAALEGGGSGYESEYRIVRPSDGAIRWIHARADIERDGNGRPTRLVGAHLDITEQKETQEALRTSRERLRQFGEASTDVLWIRDAETLQWTYLTPAFETIYGIGREAALHGNDFRRWVELVEPADRGEALAAIRRVRAGERTSFDYRIRRPDGEVRWLRNTDFPIRDDYGVVTSIGGVGHDATELKRIEEALRASEERLRSAVEVGRVGLWDWDMVAERIHWSDEHFRMEGYAVGEVVPSYEAWASRLHPDDREATEAALRSARDSRTEYVHEFRTLLPDGAIHWCAARGKFFYDEEGRPIRMVGAMIDTTEKRELLDRQMVLIHEVQHRTRNLIGVVRSLVERTLEASSSADEFRTSIRDRLGALSRVNGLLSRLESGEKITFDELLRAELSAHGLLQNGAARQLTLEGPTGVRLRSTTVQTFALALHELATNAVKYGALASDVGHLTIRWQVRSESGGRRLLVDWRESGVPDMPTGDMAAKGGGFGRQLIEKALPYQLKARTSYVFGADGIHCVIDMPVTADQPKI